MPRNTIAIETIGLLIERFPAAFTNTTPRWQLKIGIDRDIQQAWPDLDRRRLKVALAFYTHSCSYLRGLFAIGAVRVGFDGALGEVVTAEAARAAVQQLAARRAKKATATATTKAAKAKTVASATKMAGKPSNAPTASLSGQASTGTSLAGLRAAAQERRTRLGAAR